MLMLFHCSRGEQDDQQTAVILIRCALECRKHVSQIFADDDSDGSGSAASREPIAPANDESRVVPSARREKLYWPPLLRIAELNSGQLKCADQRVKSPTIHTMKK